MCGRFTLFEPDNVLSKEFGVSSIPPLSSRYNIAPSQAVAAVRAALAGRGQELVLLRWGLIPHWAQDSSIGNRMINARAETVAEKPAFRSAFLHRRCLIPASGFYEWKKDERRKQPYYVCRQDKRPFAFAGLWELWKEPDGSPVESCALITTNANELIAQVHDRMPVILPPAAYDLWLDTEIQDRDRLLPLLHSYPAEEMESYPVGFLVNDPKTDDRQCITHLPS